MPQSVLSTDLGYRGNLPSVYQKIYGIDYYPSYIVFDDSAKFRNITSNEFNRKVSQELDAVEVAQKFITTTARTARRLIRTAQIISSPARLRVSHIRQDLLEDLNIYWNAYEEHSPSMYSFWDVQSLISDTLVEELKKAVFQSEVDNGLPHFVTPSEPTWFSLEQQNIALLKSRFAESSDEKAALEAAASHAETFGFSAVPFNLGVEPSNVDILARMKQFAETIENEVKPLDGLPKNLVQLGKLVCELLFWKSERIDACALADHYVTPIYKKVADLVELP